MRRKTLQELLKEEIRNHIDKINELIKHRADPNVSAELRLSLHDSITYHLSSIEVKQARLKRMNNRL